MADPAETPRRAPDDVPSPRCLVSPRCRPAADMLARVDLPPDLPAFWVHLGPIGAQTPLAMHREFVSLMHPPPPNLATHRDDHERRTLVAPRRALFTTLDARPELLAFRGWHLDHLALTQRRPGQARPLVVTRTGQASIVVWPVAAIAWKTADGPYAELLLAPGDDSPEVVWHFGLARVTADGQAELQRATDLLLGRASHIGRPSRLADPHGRLLAERAERMKRERPGMTWEQVAGLLGADPRTLRTYRADLRRDRSAARLAGPTMLTEKD